MKPWLAIALVSFCLAACESTVGLYADAPVKNEVQLTGEYFPVEEVDQAPVPTRQSAPAFPSKMHKAGFEGTAFIVLIVSPTGVPEQIQVSEATHPLFAQAAVDAVRKWRYEPGKKNGQPVATKLTLPIEFRREPATGF